MLSLWAKISCRGAYYNKRAGGGSQGKHRAQTEGCGKNDCRDGKAYKKILVNELYKNEIADNNYIAIEQMQIPNWLEAVA